MPLHDYLIFLRHIDKEIARVRSDDTLGMDDIDYEVYEIYQEDINTIRIETVTKGPIDKSFYEYYEEQGFQIEASWFIDGKNNRRYYYTKTGETNMDIDKINNTPIYVDHADLFQAVMEVLDIHAMTMQVLEKLGCSDVDEDSDLYEEVCMAWKLDIYNNTFTPMLDPVRITKLMKDDSPLDKLTDTIENFDIEKGVDDFTKLMKKED